VAQNDPTYVITQPMMLSYPHIAKPQPSKDGRPPKFSASLVALPGTPVDDLKAAVMATAKEFFGDKVKVPGGFLTVEQAFAEGVLHYPLRKDAVAKGYPAGSIFINARTERQPQCVYRTRDANGKAVKIPQEKIAEELYPGSMVRASLRAFGFDKEGKRGVSFALNNLQKWADGERIDGRVAAEDEFEADLNQEPASLDDVMG
jgi:hypothetical protein